MVMHISITRFKLSNPSLLLLPTPCFFGCLLKYFKLTQVPNNMPSHPCVLQCTSLKIQSLIKQKLISLNFKHACFHSCEYDTHSPAYMGSAEVYLSPKMLAFSPLFHLRSTFFCCCLQENTKILHQIMGCAMAPSTKVQ